MRVVLLSTYELGRQPFGLASPAAWLLEAGFDVLALDLSRQRFDEAAVRDARLVAFYLPMHTATRLALPVVTRVKQLAPDAVLCAYGLYARLNAEMLRELGIGHLLGGEFEAALVALAEEVRDADVHAGSSGTGRLKAAPTYDRRKAFQTYDETEVGPTNNGPKPAATNERKTAPAQDDRIPRLAFRVPAREGLPPPARYARLHLADGSTRTVGYTEASRGCKHRCRHCPVVPIYDGQFRIVPADVVVEDVRRQVAAGATHITFGDPDFFNGIRHALAVVERLRSECPGVTYDVTIKIEHLVRHAGALPRLAETGCLFVTSAVESFDDDVLVRLDKGHTRADVERAVALCRTCRLTLVPTFVAFTPWTSLDGYVDLLDSIERLELAPCVAPIQLAIRLLVTAGSRLLDLDDVRQLVGPFDRAALAYPWRHPDERVDRLQARVERYIGGALRADRPAVFQRVRALARAAVEGDESFAPLPPGTVRGRIEVPWLDEPWFC